MPNTTPIKDILDNLIAVYDEAGEFGEPPIKSGFTIVGKEEAEQAIQTYIDNKIEEALNKQRGMQKITAYIPIEKGGLDEG